MLPPGRIKRWVEQADVRGLVLRNMPFKYAPSPHLYVWVSADSKQKGCRLEPVLFSRLCMDRVHISTHHWATALGFLLAGK